MKEYLKQHFVPQFYLKRFGEYLYCYDKLNDKIHKNSIKNIGHERLFYDTKISGGKIERIINNLDNKFARSYLYVLEKKSLNDIPPDIKFDFFLFLSCQMNRTRGHRDEIIDIYNKMAQKLNLSEEFSFTDDEVKANHVSMIFKPLFPFAGILSSRVWKILENKTTKPLWTSDNPFVLTNQLDFGYYGNLGLFSKGLEIHLPLNNTYQLISFDPSTHKLRNKYNFMTSETLEWHNMLHTKYSSRWIYSSDDDFELAKRFLKENPEFKNPPSKITLY